MRSALLAGTAAALLFAGVSSAAESPYQHLDPGETASLAERVPVNMVFVGFDLSGAEENAFLAELPNRSDPVVRSRLWYGVTEPLGIEYTYSYKVFETNATWENSFFEALAGLAVRAPRTLFQEIYNDQDGTRDVGANHYIDPAAVEKWLIQHAPQGVDTSRNTVFFINWWGRSDFIDHVYLKAGEPDPDTGYDFALQRESRKIVAWGGTTPDDEETGLGALGVNRVWFHDLSAGPEAWGGSYDIENDDLDGDGEPDYRIPVSWEYSANGYRAPSEIPSDLGKVTRYVALNLLFTSSPLYPPYLTPPRLPASIDLRVDTYEGWDGVDASQQYRKLDLLRQEEGELLPQPLEVTGLDEPFDGKIRQCYLLWLEDETCFGQRPFYPPFANLFVSNALRLPNQQTDGKGEYTAAGFDYATNEEDSASFLGFADDNYIDGTQSMIFSFISPSIVEAGYGLTTTEIHEYGHHFGMSHPHDGYDSSTGIDYEPTGPYFFAWLGDESNSIMSYIDVNWDFSQFDRDNIKRFQAAGYITNANTVAEMVLASERRDRPTVIVYLNFADAEIGRAERALRDHDYAKAWEHARQAYDYALDAARSADVEVKPSNNGWFVMPKARDRDATGFLYAGVDKAGPGTKRWQP